MEKERKLIVAGNWKMNKTVAESIDLANGLVRELKDVTEVDIAVCPPFTALAAVSEIVIDSNIRLGAQNMSENGYGAHTGEIAAGMLKEFSAKYLILGHSERRQYQRESDELVAAKAKTAHESGLKPIVCVGEQLDDREGSRTEEVVGTQIRGSLAGLTTAQMEGTVVAYEPVWAIGTGKTPTTEQIDEVHDFIRARLVRRFGEAEGRAIRLLYGGSVKPGNAAEIFATDNVDGALVGGASLKAEDFSPIIKALEATA